MQSLKLKRLEIIWYEKLKTQGFDDIEDVSKKGRPLKDWHSLRFKSLRIQDRKLDMTEYQEMTCRFNNEVTFEDVCVSITSHGNSASIDEAKLIWSFHLKGMTERGIAMRLGRSKTCIHGVIQRILEWLKVI